MATATRTRLAVDDRCVEPRSLDRRGDPTTPRLRPHPDRAIEVVFTHGASAPVEV